MEVEERYPDLSFLAHVTEFSEERPVWNRFEHLFDPKEAEVLYVVGFSPYIKSLVEWVKKEIRRDIVFLEEDIRVIREILEGVGKEILREDQIHFKFRSQEESIEEFASKLAGEFPSESLAFLDLKGDTESFEKVRLAIVRKSVVEVAVHKEMLHYQKLFSNLHRNFYRLSDAFDLSKWKGAFQGKPAVICGAGPSLGPFIQKLREIEEKSLIFAAGSAIAALTAADIFPHLLFAIDPNVEEFTRLALHTAFHVPLIYGNRVRTEVFESFSGPHGYISTGTGGFLEEWIEKELGIEDPKLMKGFSEEAQTVTCLALASAIYFGCDPIFFAGVDLSYGDGKRYPKGVLSEAEASLEERFDKVSEMILEREGKRTAAKWIMERDAISTMIAEHPEHTFIDITGKGLRLKGLVPADGWERYTQDLFDPRGKIHAKVMETPFAIPKEKIEEKLNEFEKSLQRVHLLLTEMIQECEKSIETPLMVALAMDLEEEMAYKLVLSFASYAYAAILRKEHRPSEGERGEHILRLKLYKRLQRVVEEYLKQLN